MDLAEQDALWEEVKVAEGQVRKGKSGRSRDGI
jgi:hypothetical protein